MTARKDFLDKLADNWCEKYKQSQDSCPEWICSCKYLTGPKVVITLDEPLLDKDFVAVCTYPNDKR